MVWLSLTALILALLASFAFGASNIGPSAALQSLRDALLGRAPADQDAELARTILFDIRLPRLIAAALVGGALAAAGVVSQGLFRNDLASPSVLGTEAGGSLAAVLVFYLGAQHTHWVTMPLAAFLGALAATTLVFRLASRTLRMPMETLLLTGFALNALFGALTSLVISLSLEDYQKAGAVLHWLLGGFAAKGWEHVAMGILPVTAGLAMLFALAPRLDVLALGEEVAASLSVDLVRLRRIAVIAMAILVGAAVAVGGAIPFVGLIVPHATRRLVGPSHRRLLVLSTLNGMTLVVIADLIARTIRAPAELEVGILTSLLGAPFFLMLLKRKRRWA